MTRRAILRSGFAAAAAVAERVVDSVPLCWCPAGGFIMGSPPNEAERVVAVETTP